jgi:S-DNA-T family DNA segregation ATPase FtsK/SpoIIIE
MARHKKSAKRKSKKAIDESSKEQNYLWRQVYAFILIILALFLLLGGFGWGGSLPIALFDWAAKGFGLVAYLLAIIFVYWAFVKLKDEKHRLPVGIILSSIFFVFCLSGMLHVFIERNEASMAASQGTYGGFIGYWFSGLLMSFLSSMTAFVTFLILAWLAFMVMFGIAPKNMLRSLRNMFRRKSDDTDLGALKAKEIDFKVSEGVPVVHHDRSEGEGGASGGPKQATTIMANEDHAALTATSDPDWQFPGIELLDDRQDKADPGDTKAKAEKIRSTLAEMSVLVEMEGANVGPKVTQYTLLPLPGQKLSKIAANEQNISFELGGVPIRIEAPIPGKRAVGIEVPNKQSATVRLHSILTSQDWTTTTKALSFAVGKDIAGKPVIASLDKMPHLLVAGQTGSGKSVMINTILASFLYRNSPSDLKLILIDPKYVEMSPYNGIPHLLTPVITEPEKCISALKWSVAEMERRLKAFSAEGRGNIAEYNAERSEERMPYIVIVIDEMADFMMAAGRDMEALVARIAQKARASGIHLILATQRPEVKVVTGLIKANVPARIAFTVVNQIDSRVVINDTGAEKLLGDGDMLFVTAEMPKPVRLQGALIEKPETKKICNFLRAQSGPKYNDEVISMPVQLSGRGGVVESYGTNVEDDMWRDAVRVVVENGKASTSLLQRRLRIGYGRASRIIDTMEERGIVGPADGARPREVLVRDVDEVFNDTSEVSDSAVDGSEEFNDIDVATRIPVDEDSQDDNS